jgi:Protein of unknown function (DUF1566)
MLTMLHKKKDPMKKTLSALAVLSLTLLLSVLLAATFTGCDAAGEDEAETTCEAQTTRCDAGDVVKCDAAGTSWEIFEACDDGCSDGQCLDASCQPDCSDHVCGDDGCGGSCGSCSEGEDCQDGQCTEDTPTPSGVWTDPDSGLTWMDPPMQFQDNVKNWEAAKAACAALDLDGQTDWRLPTIEELRTLIRGCPSTMPGGTCEVTDACQDSTCYLDSPPCVEGCASSEGPTDVGAGMGCYWPEAFGMKASCFLYWTSNPVSVPDPNSTYVAAVNFDEASVDYYPDYSNMDARCVRQP